jgi:hypothetical protein
VGEQRQSGSEPPDPAWQAAVPTPSESSAPGGWDDWGGFVAGAPQSVPAPDIALEDTSGAPQPAGQHRRGSHRPRRRYLIFALFAASLVVVLSLVAVVQRRENGVHAAFASLLAKPTLRVVFAAHSSNGSEEASLSKYAVALSVTSENGQAPLSGSDGVDNYEVSVLRQGVDVADVAVADHALYARLDLKAIDPNGFARVMRSVRGDIPAGPARNLVEAFLTDRWVGIKDSTLKSLAKDIGATGQPPNSTINFDDIRNAFTMSFAQSWDAWASIREVSAKHGVTVYALNLPVQHFVSTLVNDIKQPVLKALPKADVPWYRSLLNSASSAIRRIPANLAIPMTMRVTNGSLSQLDIRYKGDSLDLAISHPSVGVAAPAGASMLTASILRSLFDDLLGCAHEGGTSASSAGILGCSVSKTVSAGSGSSSSDGVSFTGTGSSGSAAASNSSS